MFEIAQSSAPQASDPLAAILRELNESCREIETSLVISRDGLTMGSLGEVLDSDRVGAVYAALFSLGVSTVQDLQRGDLEEILLKGKEGYTLLVQAGPQAMLTILTKANANLGLVFLEARRAAKAITAAL